MNANLQHLDPAAIARTLAPARPIISGGVVTLEHALPMTPESLAALEALWHFEATSDETPMTPARSARRR